MEQWHAPWASTLHSAPVCQLESPRCQWGLLAWSLMLHGLGNQPEDGPGRPITLKFSGTYLFLGGFGESGSSVQSSKYLSASSPNSFLCPNWSLTPGRNHFLVTACLCYSIRWLSINGCWREEKGEILSDPRVQGCTSKNLMGSQKSKPNMHHLWIAMV